MLQNQVNFSSSIYNKDNKLLGSHSTMINHRNIDSETFKRTTPKNSFPNTCLDNPPTPPILVEGLEEKKVHLIYIWKIFRTGAGQKTLEIQVRSISQTKSDNQVINPLGPISIGINSTKRKKNLFLSQTTITSSRDSSHTHVKAF